MKKITAQEFDKKFDDGEDITEYLDFSSAIRLKDLKRLKIHNKQVEQSGDVKQALKSPFNR